MELKETAARLFEVAKRLNEATDELNEVIDVINDKLKGMNLGVAVWVPVRDDLQIGYAKTPAWGIAVSKGLTVWPFAKSPRQLRMEVVDFLPALLKALAGETARLSETLEKNLEFLERISLVNRK